MSDTSLIFNLVTKDKASKGLKGVKGGIDKLSKAILGLAAGAGIGLAMIGNDFQSAYNEIRVGTGATGKDLEELKGVFKDVLSSTSHSMEDVASTVADFNTLTGATGKELDGLTRTFLNLQKITGSDIEISKITRVFGDWDIATENQAETMDKLFRVSQTTGIGIDDLASKVVSYGAPFRQFGFSFEESAAILGKWQKEGVNTEVVISGLRKANSTFAKDSKDPAKGLAQTIKAMKGAKTEGKALGIAMEVFGAKAGPDMAAAILEGRFEIDDLMASLEGNEDTINGLAAETETWQDKLTKLKNQGMVALEPVAMRVLGVLEQFAVKLQKASVWARDNTGKVRAFAIAVGALATAVLLAKIGLMGYNVVMTIHNGLTATSAALASRNAVSLGLYAVKIAIVKTATGVWTAVQWALNAALYANPYVAIVIGIVALIAAIVILWKKNEGFRNFIIGAWNAIWGVMKGGFNWAKRNWPLLVGILTGPLGLTVAYFVSKLGAIIRLIRGMPGRIGRAASGMWGGIKDAFKAAMNWIIGRWNSLSFKLPSISAFGKTIGGTTIGVPPIPFMAKGGDVQQAGSAVVGEAGPELLQLPQGARVTPLTRGGGMGNQTVTVVFDVRGGNSEMTRLVRKIINDSTGGNVQRALGRGVR